MMKTDLPRNTSSAPSRPMSVICVLGLVLTCAASPSTAADGATAVSDKALAPLPSAPIAAAWRDSWREDWVYQQGADFSLSAAVRISKGKDVRWWASIVPDMEKLPGEINLEVGGHARSETGVLQKSNDEILLSRAYSRSDVRRASYRKPVGDPTFVDTILDKIVDDKERGSLIKTLIGTIVTYTVTGGDQGPTGKTVAVLAANWIGEHANKWIGDRIKEQGLIKRPDGGIEISPDSPLLRNADSVTTKLNELANLALQLSEEFKDRAFLIRASTKSGEELDTRQIYEEGKDLATFVEKKNSVGRAEAVDWLQKRMLEYKKPSASAHGVFQRETFALSKQIFDNAERKPTDTWVVSAEFFNSFLHPELKGRFRGDVVLRYKGDPDVPEVRNGKVSFKAREIEILPKGKVDGQTRYSTLEYVEERFSAKLAEDTEAVLFIDKNWGYVRQANLFLKSDLRAGLPAMAILEGFEVTGSCNFKVAYTCDGENLKKPAGAGSPAPPPSGPPSAPPAALTPEEDVQRTGPFKVGAIVALAIIPGLALWPLLRRRRQ